jgi:4-oxalomesaconate tautomerase
MNLGDVRERTVPKMCLIAAPRDGGAISTRSFIPHRCHASIGVLGAVSVATAAVLPGTVCDGLAVTGEGEEVKHVAVEHPTGEFTVQLTLASEDGSTRVQGAALLRTARWLFDGVVGIPAAIWRGGNP